VITTGMPNYFKHIVTFQWGLSVLNGTRVLKVVNKINKARYSGGRTHETVSLKVVSRKQCRRNAWAR